jgi:hypothetical protein
LDRLQSSIDSVSDGDDSKERKATQDDKNLESVSPRKISRRLLLTVHSRESKSVGQAENCLKNAHAVEYRLERKRDKPNAVGRVERWDHVESVELGLNRRERLMPSQS